MQPILTVSGVSKTYKSGFNALKPIDLEIRQGEIFGLLGPNGAGKTTLINIICGIVTPSSGTITVGGHDVIRDFRAARSMIGLVPQELTTDAFVSPRTTVAFTRGLFGKKANPALVEKILKDLSLWDKKDEKIITLSGGMKRRVLIAKALAHEPQVLFLDEPTAGVDVELRKDMWEIVRQLRASGVTIILTTHYIDEAEEMADRIGVINKGEIILVEDKAELMRKLGKKQLTVELEAPVDVVPAALAGYGLALSRDHAHLTYTYDTRSERSGIATLLGDLAKAGVRFKDIQTNESSLEEIFVSLVKAEMNLEAVKTIYIYEMSRTFRTLLQSIIAPVLTTALYFIVFGSAIGSRIQEIDGISYGAFIVPGLIMLTLLTLSISNASIAIYFPKFIGTINEYLSAPVSYLEIVIAFVGAAATKSIMLGLVILATAAFFVPIRIDNVPVMMLFMVLTAVTFSLFGFIIGLWADGFEKLQVIPLLFVTPLTFLGGTFYSINMLPPFWQTVSLFNPVVYLVSGFRWSFYSVSDVGVVVSLVATFGFLIACLAVVAWIFKTGYRLKT